MLSFPAVFFLAEIIFSKGTFQLKMLIKRLLRTHALINYSFS